MSEFKVTVEEIESLEPIAKSDKVVLARLVGFTYTFVVQKNLYNVGSLVFFFPEDSILTEGFVTKYDLGFLKRRQGKYVVDTIKLRGCISNGLLFPVSKLISASGLSTLDRGDDKYDWVTFNEMFDVTKYEEEEFAIDTPHAKRGNGVTLPKDVPRYDIESIQRFGEYFTQWMANKHFVFVEKIEGQQIKIHARRGEKVMVCSHNCALSNDSYYYKVAERQGLVQKVQELSDSGAWPTVTFFGELVGPGIQRNIYNLDEKKIFLFDIKLGDIYMDILDMTSWCDLFDIAHVPIIDTHDPDINKITYTPQEMVALASDKSELADVWREGYIIRMVQEGLDDMGERIILKVRSESYKAMFAAGDVTYVANP